MGWLYLYYLLEVLKWLIIVRALMSWVVDPRSDNPVVLWIRKVTDAVLQPLAAILPPVGGMDLSPLVGIFAIHGVQVLIAQGPLGG